MAGELPLDDAFTRMDQDIADQVAAGQAVARGDRAHRRRNARRTLVAAAGAPRAGGGQAVIDAPLRASSARAGTAA